MIVPHDSRKQYSGLEAVIAHYDSGLPPLGSPAWQQINSDRYILSSPVRARGRFWATLSRGPASLLSPRLFTLVPQR
jgi:hypothetical protein